MEKPEKIRSKPKCNLRLAIHRLFNNEMPKKGKLSIEVQQNNICSPKNIWVFTFSRQKLGYEKYLAFDKFGRGQSRCCQCR